MYPIIRLFLSFPHDHRHFKSVLIKNLSLIFYNGERAEVGKFSESAARGGFHPVSNVTTYNLCTHDMLGKRSMCRPWVTFLINFK